MASLKIQQQEFALTFLKQYNKNQIKFNLGWKSNQILNASLVEVEGGKV
jgi:hypothetical protein